MIGCVDSRTARHAITRTQTYWHCHYWLDLGNNADSGQFVLGEPENGKNQSSEQRLPNPGDVRGVGVTSSLSQLGQLLAETFVNEQLHESAFDETHAVWKQSRLRQAETNADAACPVADWPSHRAWQDWPFRS